MDCLFCDFATGTRKKHINGMTFRKLHESKHALSFLSIDFPAAEAGHIIVIPKSHFYLIEDIPDNILFDLIKEVRVISSVLKIRNEGTNILLNNGETAGQKIPHAHFHVIARNKGDNIDLEQFQRKKISAKKFLALHNSLARDSAMFKYRA